MKPVIFHCAIIGQQAARDARLSTTNCVKENRATPEGQLLSTRLWRGDDTDTAAKLSDPNPLSKNERDALVTRPLAAFFAHPQVERGAHQLGAHLLVVLLRVVGDSSGLSLTAMIELGISVSSGSGGGGAVQAAP